jgi:hypothetical protein
MIDGQLGSMLYGSSGPHPSVDGTMVLATERRWCVQAQDNLAFHSTLTAYSGTRLIIDASFLLSTFSEPFITIGEIFSTLNDIRKKRLLRRHAICSNQQDPYPHIISII